MRWTQCLVSFLWKYGAISEAEVQVSLIWLLSASVSLAPRRRTPTMSTTSDGGDPTTLPSPHEAYKELTLFFSSRAGEVTAIEVLPVAFPLPWGATSPILQDGPNLGITKRALVQAFLVGRQIFFDTLKLITPNEQETEEAMNATQVILLFDPEHTTAANFRKRRLLGLRAARSTVTSGIYADIKNELVFLESLLTSPLHKHTKSPTLWHHRRWLVKEFLNEVGHVRNSPGSDNAGSNEIFGSLWAAELGVVERSGDRHPRNYYAWAYARWLVAYLADENLSPPDESGIPLLTGCSAPRIHVWCLAHPTDISGWSFLVHLLQNLTYEPNLQREIFERGWEFTCKLSWEGEALWWFLRTVLAMEGILPVELRRQYFQSIVDGQLKTGALDSDNHRTTTNSAVQAVRFCAKFGKLECAFLVVDD